MKIRSLFLAIAGLGLVACVNEKVEQPAKVAVSGVAALTIQINNPGMTKAEVDGTDGEDGGKAAITVSELIVKYLPSNQFARLENLTITNGKAQTLYDVPEGTTGFVVVGNSLSTEAEEAAFSSTSEKETNTKADKSAANATVYGVTNELSPSGNVIMGNGTANGGKANTSYSEYTATVTVRPVTARLEVSGLKFEPKAEGSDFTSLTLEGVFLNDYYNEGSMSTTETAGITVGDPKFMDKNPEALVDPVYPQGVLGSTFGLADWFPTDDSGDEAGLLFYDGSQTPTLPSDGKVWAYNFFVNADEEEVSHSLPKFTVVVNPVYKEVPGFGKPLYAVISKYQKDNGDAKVDITKFEAGKIYKITSLSLPEDVLTPDITGNQEIAITATVTVEDWVIEQTTGIWVGQN